MSENSAHDLVTQLRQSLGRERHALTDFILALAELDRRRLYVALGYSSAWSFCCRALGLSETATHYRLLAARQVQQQPALADQIREGKRWSRKRPASRPARSKRSSRGSIRNRYQGT